MYITISSYFYLINVYILTSLSSIFSYLHVSVHDLCMEKKCFFAYLDIFISSICIISSVSLHAAIEEVSNS